MEYNQAEVDTTILPGYVKGWAIADLIMSGLRVFMIPLAILGYYYLPDSDPIKSSAAFELVFHVAILIFGLWSNIAILMKKNIGYILGKINVGVTGLSFFLGGYQVYLQSQTANTDDTATLIGMIIGGCFALVVRTILIVCYGIAVKRYGKFIGSKEPQNIFDEVEQRTM